MVDIFPDEIKKLSRADISLNGINAYVSQGENHQIIFMEFNEDVKIPEHSHDSQWETVLDGIADVTIDGVQKRFKKGDKFFIPAGVKHHANVFAGYASIAFFNEKNRYEIKK